MGTRMLLLRRILLRAPKPISSISSNQFTINSTKLTDSLHFPIPNFTSYHIQAIGFSSQSNGPAQFDYSSMLQEDEYQKLANSTIHHLLEKLEEYGDSVEIDGFDVDYGTEVLTLKLGSSGTYVINKQTPNRQIWMSSPVSVHHCVKAEQCPIAIAICAIDNYVHNGIILSGPSRFDWDQNAQAWIYRRTKQELIKVLETELEQLCGQPISLS